MPPIITLLSDFGYQDVYVGVLKGVILQINPQIRLVDLTHAIPPQDIGSGSFQLANACAYFPSGTVHLVIVDPGVGSQRRGIAMQTQRGFFVGPDNGLFSLVLDQDPPLAAVELTNPDYWRSSTPSATFHGRDIFAPVAAHLASGVSLEQLGESIPVTELVRLPHQSYQPILGGWQGHIQAIDGFGNLITNLPAELIVSQAWQLELGGRIVKGCQTYSQVERGGLVGLVGSHGWLEVAVNGGSAAQVLDLKVGDGVRLWL